MGEEESIYQGDVDRSGRPNGRGIMMEPCGGIDLGYWKEGMRHGP